MAEMLGAVSWSFYSSFFVRFTFEVLREFAIFPEFGWLFITWAEWQLYAEPDH